MMTKDVAEGESVQRRGIGRIIGASLVPNVRTCNLFRIDSKNDFTVLEIIQQQGNCLIDINVRVFRIIQSVR